jgi:hypothetical protein
LLILLILRWAGLLTLLAGVSLSFSFELFSAFLDLYPKGLLLLVRQVGLKSQRGIGHG